MNDEKVSFNLTEKISEIPLKTVSDPTNLNASIDPF